MIFMTPPKNNCGNPKLHSMTLRRLTDNENGKNGSQEKAAYKENAKNKIASATITIAESEKGQTKVNSEIISK